MTIQTTRQPITLNLSTLFRILALIVFVLALFGVNLWNPLYLGLALYVLSTLV